MSKTASESTILVVDDAPDTLEVIERNLRANGYRVLACARVADALDVLDREPVDLVVTDWKMPGASGLDLVRHIRENREDTEVMMITGYASIEGAVKAVKLGAGEYLAKPFTDDELLGAVARLLDKLSLRRAGRVEAATLKHLRHGLLGDSAAIRRVLADVAKSATSNATALIAGESGTGKELVARAIHYNSARSSGPFAPVNCASIPEGLLESELFGHVKGAFTGAIESRAGFFQTADGGTIFLDEISEISVAMQVKLLRVLQEKEVCMVGSTRPRRIDARILASTNKDLSALVKQGAFREDLYFRVNVLTIVVPPLRERGDDILILARHFVEKFARELGRNTPDFEDTALEALKAYDWPGNVRELENIVQRVVVMSDHERIGAADLPEMMRFSVERPPGPLMTLAENEERHIRSVLTAVGGNKTRAAQILGIDRKTLREKTKRFGLSEAPE
ncbi:MAG: sigma-54-dependent Fis family transcriptional regulator [Deltaproteobacteria bacterium]|nr:sigma-54-dependent Fis family transcriptional regulator [Deltaproteobacteria bacterium]